LTASSGLWKVWPSAGHAKAIRALVAGSADPNVPRRGRSSEYTPLHMAASNGRSLHLEHSRFSHLSAAVDITTRCAGQLGCPNLCWGSTDVEPSRAVFDAT
jgi:hypothetical protein